MDKAICLRCRVEKSADEFPPSTMYEDGIGPFCKSCEDEQQRQMEQRSEDWRLHNEVRHYIDMWATAQDREFCAWIQQKRRDHLYAPGQMIYALIDPRTDVIRYVGRTRQPKKRLSEHAGKGTGENRKHRNWIMELREARLQPIMRILEQVAEDEFVLEREYRWILKLVHEGANLTNAEARHLEWVEEVKQSRCRDFLTTSSTSRYLAVLGFDSVRNPGDTWGHKPLPLSEAIVWCLRLCPDEFPVRLEDAARRLGYFK